MAHRLINAENESLGDEDQMMNVMQINGWANKETEQNKGIVKSIL